MNTRTGAWRVQEDIVNHTGGSISFTAPDTNDWALLLYDWKTNGSKSAEAGSLELKGNEMLKL
jgi:hypothetical protein